MPRRFNLTGTSFELCSEAPPTTIQFDKDKKKKIKATIVRGSEEEEFVGRASADDTVAVRKIRLINSGDTATVVIATFRGHASRPVKDSLSLKTPAGITHLFDPPVISLLSVLTGGGGPSSTDPDSDPFVRPGTPTSEPLNNLGANRFTKTTATRIVPGTFFADGGGANQTVNDVPDGGGANTGKIYQDGVLLGGSAIDYLAGAVDFTFTGAAVGGVTATFNIP